MSRMIKKLTVSVIILSLQILTVAAAWAWKVPVEISTSGDDDAKLISRLVIGIEQGATDDFDNLWDTPALISLSDPESPVLLRAYMRGREGGSGAAKYLWKDIRGASSAGDTEWEITVDSVPAGRRVELSWNILPGLLRPGEVLLLKDSGGAGGGNGMIQVNTARDSGYAYVSGGEGPRVLSLVLSKESPTASGSGGGSGFGCGTVRSGTGGPPDYGTAAVVIVSLLLPLLVPGFLRLKQSAALCESLKRAPYRGHRRQR